MKSTVVDESLSSYKPMYCSREYQTSTKNTTIADKITQSKFLPQNLQQCFEKALRLEASLQLSEGVNMAQKTTVMNVEVDADDEVNLIKRC